MILYDYVIKCKHILHSFTLNGKACFASILLQVSMQDVADKLPMAWNSETNLRALSSATKMKVIEIIFLKGINSILHFGF